jgi:hypothetical protein
VLAEMSVERRDAAILQWRARLFGDVMAGCATCPRCEVTVEVTLQVRRVEVPEDRFVVESEGARLSVRMPTSLDLAAVAGVEDPDDARRQLLNRCIENSSGQAAGNHDARLYEVEQELERRADVSAAVADVTCPDCGHEWRVELDIAAYAWREVEILAQRLLRDVDVLARCYGWSEHDILALSPARRRWYLERAS